MYFECEADYNAYCQAEAEAEYQAQAEADAGEYEHLQELIRNEEYDLYALVVCYKKLEKAFPEAAKYLISEYHKVLNERGQAMKELQESINPDANQKEDDLPF
jgi:hypothetical protein